MTIGQEESLEMSVRAYGSGTERALCRPKTFELPNFAIARLLQGYHDQHMNDATATKNINGAVRMLFRLGHRG